MGGREIDRKLAAIFRPVNFPDARDRIVRCEHCSGGIQREPQRRLPRCWKRGKTRRFERRVISGVMGAMHTPLEPRNVGEVRQLLRWREAGEERGEALAVLVQIAARRRMTSSILA